MLRNGAGIEVSLTKITELLVRDREMSAYLQTKQMYKKTHIEISLYHISLRFYSSDLTVNVNVHVHLVHTKSHEVFKQLLNMTELSHFFTLLSE
jgi:hypothetical protein